jgi:hypothetical protein
LAFDYNFALHQLERHLKLQTEAAVLAFVVAVAQEPLAAVAQELAVLAVQLSVL